MRRTDGTVHCLYLAPGQGADPGPVDSVEAVAPNGLVSERFRVGGTVCLDTELCEPCSYLERHLAERGLREALAGRGGLRCRVVDGGHIGRGDRIRRSSTGAAGSEG